MKSISKHTLLELARVTRKYAKTGDVDILDSRIKFSKQLSVQAFRSEGEWLSFMDLVNAICGVCKLKNCTNDEIINVFELLDFEVVDETDNETQ